MSTFEEIYSQTKKAMNLSKDPVSYIREKNNRTFSELYNDDSNKLNEARTYSELFDRHSTRLKESEFDDILSSEELEEFLTLTQGEIVSTERQINNGTLVIEFSNGRIVELSQKGYIRTESGNGQKRILNSKDNLMNYSEAINYLTNKFNKTPEWFTDDFQLRANWSWDKNTVDKRNAQIRKRTGRDFEDEDPLLMY